MTCKEYVRVGVHYYAVRKELVHIILEAVTIIRDTAVVNTTRLYAHKPIRLYRMSQAYNLNTLVPTHSRFLLYFV